jgi:hypothetical protein
MTAFQGTRPSSPVQRWRSRISFATTGAAWRRANASHVSLDQLKVMSAIERCRARHGKRHSGRGADGGWELEIPLDLKKTFGYLKEAVGRYCGKRQDT